EQTGNSGCNLAAPAESRIAIAAASSAERSEGSDERHGANQDARGAGQAGCNARFAPTTPDTRRVLTLWFCGVATEHCREIDHFHPAAAPNQASDSAERNR